MDNYHYYQAFIALFFVLGLILVIAFLFKKFSSDNWLKTKLAPPNKRLSIIETKILDTRRKLALIKFDEKEYLLLLGKETELVISCKENSTNLLKKDLGNG